MTRNQRRQRKNENMVFFIFIVTLLTILAMTTHATAEMTGIPADVHLRVALTTSDISSPEDICAAYEEALK